MVDDSAKATVERSLKHAETELAAADERLLEATLHYERVAQHYRDILALAEGERLLVLAVSGS